MKNGRSALLLASLAVSLSGAGLAALSAGRAVQGWSIPLTSGPAPRPWLNRKKGRGGQ
jgi:hypothetical protein